MPCMHACMQAGAITGFVSAFVEGPIDFFKSQIQVQIIRSRGSADYKRARLSPTLHLGSQMMPAKCGVPGRC